MKDKFFYVLECTTQECDAEFYVNDIPIVRRGPKHGNSYQGQSNQYLVDGLNEIAIVVGCGPSPAESITGPNGLRQRVTLKGARATAKLRRYKSGSVAGGPDGVELMSVGWEAGDSPAPKMSPLTVSTAADLGALFGTPPWITAAPVVLDDDVREEIQKLLEELQRTLAAGNPELLIELGAPRFEAVERAYGLAPGERAELIRMLAKEDAAQPWWGMQPLDPAQFSLRLCGRQRLVECLSKDWMPILRETPDPKGEFSTYSMLFARIQNRWQIVL